MDNRRRVASSVEEEVGVLKSGHLIASFYPVKAKKTYYVVLGNRALELHESEKKSQKKNRHPRHLIDLSTCFNINRHFDGRMKYCVAVMTPDETLFLRAETDKLTDEWFEVLMSAVIPARALRLGRPVPANEFFECAWDVTVVGNPKLRKPVKSEQLINICTKDPSLLGPHRLCFYHHTIILCRRGIEPASSDDLPPSGVPPFKTTDFVEFPRQYMASFGSQERYFFMVMGRSSPPGSGELWVQCDCEEVAADMHNKLNKIIERESEKKKQMSKLSFTHAHRDRLHTYTGVRRPTTSKLKKLTPDEMSLKERRAQIRDYKWAVDLIEQRTQEGLLSPNVPSFLWFNSTTERAQCSTGPSSGYHSSSSGIIRTRSFDTRIPLPLSTISVRTKTEKGKEEFPAELSLEGLQRFDVSHHRSSFASSSAADETEDSGGTLRVDTDDETNRAKTAVERQIEATIERMLPPALREQFMSYSESRKAVSTVSSRHSEYDDRADGASCSAAGSTSTNDDFLQTTPGEVSEDASCENYATMEMNSWSSGSASHLGLSTVSKDSSDDFLVISVIFFGTESTSGEEAEGIRQCEPQFTLEEVRSYVSDSSDSCYSSLATNGAPRAYSFGASHIMHQRPGRSGRKHTHPEHSSPVQDSQRCITTLPQTEDVHHLNKPTASSCTAQEDARKRAFSLGSSKSWFQKPFRKLSRDFVSRAHRLSNTSQASSTSSTGHSLIHSPNSSFLPTTSVALDPYPVSRVRSESIGSGLSTPHSKRYMSNDPTGDHVPVDFGFGALSLGKSGSGSVHSTDSPSRSRTSSFGCGQPFIGVRDPGDIVVHAADTELESFSASASRFTHERCKEHYSSSICVPSESDEADSYVGRDPTDATFSDFYVNSSHVGYEGPLNDTNSYPDSRSSQIFETIQESLSGRSSPASSKESDSVISRKERKHCDKVDRKLESDISTEMEVDKDSGRDQKQEKILGHELEFVPMDPSQ